MRVAAVNNDIALFQVRDELVDNLVNGLPRFHKDHDLAGTLEVGGQFFDAVAADDVFVLATAIDEVVDLFDGAVVHRHAESLALHIEHEVFTHDREADEAHVHF